MRDLIPVSLIIGVLTTALAPHSLQAQREEELFRTAMQVNTCQEISAGILPVGRIFLDTPYREKLLDQQETEQLIVNFRGFDCVTYVETVLALSLSRRDSCSFLPEVPGTPDPAAI